MITLPLVILAGLSVLGGLLNFPGSHALAGWLEHTLGAGEEAGFNGWWPECFAGIALLGLFTAWYGLRPEPNTLR